MAYDSNIHHRRSVRLQGYDYSSEGLYFVTLCIQEKHIPLFGQIMDEEMHMNEIGRMVERQYLMLSQKYPHIICHEYVVMPNHFHAIIQIADDVPTIKITLGQIIGYFKYQTTKLANLSTRLWQRNYYEHIIRNQHSYEEISTYILDNPRRWGDDSLHIPPRNTDKR